ncbi:hypothetical protein A2V68_01160 [candidate division Kazan bacterium RBG_13_50_9]|uniref:Reverse transcriptase domain-containing protein n=1 Tax=candidate division Kazan bacterium RBG_13_50_9 TaxID=1798535 RepID=A0A1F4NS76_UNCK3|nr:MAG: hypothetical protein A2V68_01160 [candidate division Kazan bacterium RBG_13_50_9]
MAWTEFRKGKRSKSDVQAFELHLEDNIFTLYEELKRGTYRHGGYHQFRISDPKPRLISKASVRDRLLHHAIYQILYPAFDKTFIFDSYSCRKNKGTHKGFFRLVDMARKVSKNYTCSCWALKLDIRKFFDSVDHEVLMDLLKVLIADDGLLGLLQNIISSFSARHPEPLNSTQDKLREESSDSVLLYSRTRSFANAQDDRNRKSEDDGEEGGNDGGGKGMPLGNLTSQLFANIYLDPLDKFVKHKIKAKYYLRYADDFVLLSTDPDELLGCLVEISRFLKDKLKLDLHPDKIILRKLNWGIDFVGYVALPHYSLPRRKTVKRILQQITKWIEVGNEDALAKAMPSYLGYLSHVRAHHVSRLMRDV